MLTSFVFSCQPCVPGLIQKPAMAGLGRAGKSDQGEHDQTRSASATMNVNTGGHDGGGGGPADGAQDNTSTSVVDQTCPGCC